MFPNIKLADGPVRRAASALLLLAAFIAASPALAGNYRLTVSTAKVEIGGRTIEKMTIDGGIPGPTLRLTEGEDATITVVNETDEKTSVHWHGLMLPGMMDGSPGFNGFTGIAPGASYTYTFNIRQSGTYWYHSHSGTQDQSVLGAIVIEPAKPSPFRADRDYVVLLGDITAEDSDQVLRNLKADPGYYNYNKRTLLDFFSDASTQGFGAALRDRLDWGAMRMDPTDLADVTGYSFLVNGKTPDENETFIFRKGERVRLRLINGSAMTFFDVRVPGLKMTVVAADGNDVNPVPVDELRMGVAERYDVFVEPKEDIPYTLFAESIDRMGHARATLASSAGNEGPVPERRPRALLSMADMGMAHGADMSMAHGGHDMDGMDHDMSAMNASSDEERPAGWASGFPADAKVLAYKDLRALRAHADNSAPTRAIEMRLTGNMERYVWTLNDDRFSEAQPVRVRYGERVRLTFVNETMMAHPMHLHGMFFELENGSGDRRPLKDTVIVPPGQSVSVVLTAREVGAWPLHCHLLYHMASGMMTRFVVEPPGTAESNITPDGAVVPLAVTGAGEAHGSHAGHGGM
ncbi:MAG: multicopper oxidase domain-containing protein [Parvibaculum sp.]|nr:multicopper oxidase domain-containing protein [Parvibaculum sp.]